MEPKISIVIPTFNRAHIIKDTLDSVLRQTFKNWECLVVDDGSNDDTGKLLKNYEQIDRRIKYIIRPENRKKGANTCRNIGIEKSKGQYVQFLDSDDLLASDKLEIQLKMLETSGSNAIATCRWGGIGANQEKAKLYNGLPTYFSTRSPVELIEVYGKALTFFPPHVFLVPKSVVLKAGNWNEDLIINQDGEFFSRIILTSSEIQFCKNTYALYRSGAGDRTTGSQRSEKRRRGYMKSLELIDENIWSYINIKNHVYVKQRKTELYYKLQKENQRLIDENLTFFKERTSNLMYYYYRLYWGIRRRLFRKVELIRYP
ncbi:glycosyltransferase family 2 protein [Autumnicola musiva]|uniref:Glycosyltransferase family 2 protein n=1 Tax=Autumnicola musiva TaxID=3075589 RepID=A0ABU3D7V7_9FLAO|nr:glycosyltransferase family 2 protein [Zunongwangia sp. F117]MDT0677449.1 glycosyltransferase family 2 protein [Zunongwangia sp. F117]